MTWLKSLTARIGISVCLALTGVAPSLSQERREPPPKPPKNQVPRPQNQGRSGPYRPYQQNVPQNPGAHAGQWLREHRSMSPEQQRRALENDPRFRGLPPQQQQRYREQLERFNRLPSEQQERVLNRMEVLEHLTPEQKAQVRDFHEQMQQLPQDRRQAVRNAIQSLRAMPPDARQRAIESDAYRQHFSPQERQMLDNASRLPLAPAEPGEQPEE